MAAIKRAALARICRMYSFDEYTQIKHVMIELDGEARKSWHYTIFGDAE